MSGRIRVIAPWTDAEEDIRRRLRHYRALVSQHEACKELYDQLFPGSTAQLSDEPRGGQLDMFPIESVVDQRLDLSRKMARSLHDMQTELASIMNLIKELPPSEYTILLRRYMMAESWEQIGQRLGYCQEQAIRIHNRAIVRLGERCQTMSISKGI